MPPQRDLKALAKAAGLTKQQYVDLEARASKKARKLSGMRAVVDQAYKDSGRRAVVDQRRKELYIEEQRILRNNPTWTPRTVEVHILLLGEASCFGESFEVSLRRHRNQY